MAGATLDHRRYENADGAIALKIINVAAAALMVVLLAAPVLADATATARVHDQAFDDAMMACTPNAALELYEDNAVAIYPGEGEIGGGKSQISKLVKDFGTAFCPDDQKKAGIKTLSLAATPMGPDFIMIVRQFEVTDKFGNKALVRATELIHQKDGKWRYVVDHASVGLPLASATSGGGQK
jgi:ketosteroid isomerase-like protein